MMKPGCNNDDYGYSYICQTHDYMGFDEYCVTTYRGENCDYSAYEDTNCLEAGGCERVSADLWMSWNAVE